VVNHLDLNCRIPDAVFLAFHWLKDITNHGQADMTVMLGDFIYIMEIKLDKSTDYQVQMPNSALQQIQDKAYAQKYLGQGKKVIEVGFIFNQVQRNLVQLDWLS
jgi:hypothetical protein